VITVKFQGSPLADEVFEACLMEWIVIFSLRLRLMSLDGMKDLLKLVDW
jgi:hypothetical protein